MEVDCDNGLLGKLAAGGEIESSSWPQLRGEMIEQLDKIAHNEFPIPNLPPPIEPRKRLVSPLPSSPLERTSSQEANKENAPAERDTAPTPAVQHLEPGELPKQIVTMLEGIISHLKTFETYPPHTIQRLSELVLRPRAHYRALAPYLHAVDRVVHVTSSTNVYPLPPAIPDMTSTNINGEGVADPAVAVGWANPTNGAAAADEALGGALLTPIPWLNRRSPESNNGESSSNGETAGAQIHSESTETIDGPNGVGSIETVSVSVNGVPSIGHARGVTQGELLRQEQRAGVVPVSQLSRNHEHNPLARSAQEEDDEEQERAEATGEKQQDVGMEDEEETPHARGPEEIGAGDIGPQSVSTSFVGEGGLDSHDIDVEAAVGRKHDEVPLVEENKGDEEMDGGVKDDDEAKSDAPPTADSTVGTKRGPEENDEKEGGVKKLKEGDEMGTENAMSKD
ncbi:hypothetical protein NLU13_1487 [Sarocladium strictum]|uniref:Uncharacterized protein n=1 Tax=Sarocladium strictum TaxID=5046 RepID=A0AA39GT30_SARSR|nr:hypothetical protein NLU13_1487 [Sarocladium strictum]